MGRQDRINFLNNRRGRLVHDVLALQSVSTGLRGGVMRDTRRVVSRAREDVMATGAELASNAGQVAKQALSDTRALAEEQGRTALRNADPRQIVRRYPEVSVGAAVGLGVLGALFIARWVQDQRRRHSMRPLTTQY